MTMMYHINALLNNEEWTAVLEASALGKATGVASGDKPEAKVTKIRSGSTKFAHLTRRVSSFSHLSRVDFRSKFFLNGAGRISLQKDLLL